jgi:hypothetical protein
MDGCDLAEPLGLHRSRVVQGRRRGRVVDGWSGLSHPSGMISAVMVVASKQQASRYGPGRLVVDGRDATVVRRATFAFRPTPAQERGLHQLLEVSREVYNAALRGNGGTPVERDVEVRALATEVTRLDVAGSLRACSVRRPVSSQLEQWRGEPEPGEDEDGQPRRDHRGARGPASTRRLPLRPWRLAGRWRRSL